MQHLIVTIGRLPPTLNHVLRLRDRALSFAPNGLGNLLLRRVLLPRGVGKIGPPRRYPADEEGRLQRRPPRRRRLELLGTHRRPIPVRAVRRSDRPVSEARHEG